MEPSQSDQEIGTFIFLFFVSIAVSMCIPGVAGGGDVLDDAQRG